MIALKEKVKPKNGKIVITLPENLKDATEFILTLEKAEKSKIQKKNKIDRLQQFKGIVKDSTYQPDEEEWYKQ